MPATALMLFHHIPIGHTIIFAMPVPMDNNKAY